MGEPANWRLWLGANQIQEENFAQSFNNVLLLLPVFEVNLKTYQIVCIKIDKSYIQNAKFMNLTTLHRL